MKPENPAGKRFVRNVGHPWYVRITALNGKEVNNMPARDETGPMGLGSMTGRGYGRCAGYNAPGFARPFEGRRHVGRGYGRGYGYAAAYPYGVPYGVVPDEKTVLAAQVKEREDELKALKERISVLEQQTGNEDK
jgi:hypothetical protein